MSDAFFPSAIEKALPPLYSQERFGDEAIVYAKFFTPDSSWTWYATEYDPEQQVFFGLVVGLETELGYFSLDEMRAARGPLGLPVERDLWWEPKTIAQVRRRESAGNSKQV